jgi:hypothetical protein
MTIVVRLSQTVSSEIAGRLFLNDKRAKVYKPLLVRVRYFDFVGVQNSVKYFAARRLRENEQIHDDFKVDLDSPPKNVVYEIVDEG